MDENIRYCPHCGAQQSVNARFCGNCGQEMPPVVQAAYEQPQYDQAANQQPAYEQPSYQEPAYQQPVNAQPVNPQPVYQQAVYVQPMYAGVRNPNLPQHPTTRSLWKLILLSIVTFGIYEIVMMSKISVEINRVAGPYDGKKTMHFCLVLFIFSWLTFGIVPIVWTVKLYSRMGHELARRNIPYSFGAGTFWGWGVLGSLIFVGPFICTHKFLRAMNLLNTSYNTYG